MSKFYMARDLQTGKIVGLKILDIEKTAAFEARFEGSTSRREGEIAMKLKHPRIVETYEYGLPPKARHTWSWSFWKGRHQLAPGGPRSVPGRHRLRLIREAAEAIAAVHEAGFIHRDICPRNFFLTKNCHDLKLIDFGVTVPATPCSCSRAIAWAIRITWPPKWCAASRSTSDSTFSPSG